MQCAGKVVLVTGAQQGIGAATALAFAAEGADVAINWLDDETAARRVADGVRAAGGFMPVVGAGRDADGSFEAVCESLRPNDNATSTSTTAARPPRIQPQDAFALRSASQFGISFSRFGSRKSRLGS